MIIGVEFKDLKKLNPSITAEDLQEALPQLQEVFQKYDNIVNRNAEETK